MPYGFNEDRSKYEIQGGGGGGLSPMFVNMITPLDNPAHLDKTAREIYDHVSQGGLVIWLDDSDPDYPRVAIFTCMFYSDDSGYYKLYFGEDTYWLRADTLDDYPQLSIA